MLLIIDQEINYDQFDIHSVATFFKRFLRNIPDPIVPFDAVDEILRIRKSRFPKKEIPVRDLIKCFSDEPVPGRGCKSSPHYFQAHHGPKFSRVAHVGRIDFIFKADRKLKPNF